MNWQDKQSGSLHKRGFANRVKEESDKQREAATRSHGGFFPKVPMSSFCDSLGAGPALHTEWANWPYISCGPLKHLPFPLVPSFPKRIFRPILFFPCFYINKNYKLAIWDITNSHWVSYVSIRYLKWWKCRT